jgi:hypothetical protein
LHAIFEGFSVKEDISMEPSKILFKNFSRERQRPLRGYPDAGGRAQQEDPFFNPKTNRFTSVLNSLPLEF